MIFTKIGSSYSSSQIPKQLSNQIYLSENVDLGAYTYESSYAIKYVISGYENYAVEGREINIKPNQHLLVNNQSTVTTLPAKGKAISIFLEPETILDVQSIIQSTNLTRTLDNVEPVNTVPILFNEQCYYNENPTLKSILKTIQKGITNGDSVGEHEIDPSIFFKLSEALIIDQNEHTLRLFNLKSQKTSTIQEQYKRLLIGFEFLNDNWNRPYCLEKTATISMLSPFHFHRTFTQCFNITPYKYHLKIQMNKALQLLNEQQNSISEIAYILGYNSSTSFGRVFKKYFGKSPTTFLKIQNKQYM